MSGARLVNDDLVLKVNNHHGAFIFAAYVTVTILASVFNGIAAVTYLIGHDYPKAQADMKRVPRSWVPVLGMLLAAGSLGLLAGFAVPLLGTLALSLCSSDLQDTVIVRIPDPGTAGAEWVLRIDHVTAYTNLGGWRGELPDVAGELVEALRR